MKLAEQVDTLLQVRPFSGQTEPALFCAPKSRGPISGTTSRSRSQLDRRMFLYRPLLSVFVRKVIPANVWFERPGQDTAELYLGASGSGHIFRIESKVA